MVAAAAAYRPLAPPRTRLPHRCAERAVECGDPPVGPRQRRSGFEGDALRGRGVKDRGSVRGRLVPEGPQRRSDAVPAARGKGKDFW